MITRLTFLSLLLAAATRCKAEIDFAHDVVPILKTHCVECHGGGESKGGLSLNTRELMLDSGAIDLDQPKDSYLLELVRSTDAELQMPPPDHGRVPDEQIVVLAKWLEEQAPWEAGFTFGEQVYEPPVRLSRPELPPATDGRSHPVDRIVDAWMRERGVTRRKPIDDATFVRRASLDLVGLVPPAELVAEALSTHRPASGFRDRVVTDLLSDDIAYAEHWLTFFNDLLRNDYSGTGFITGGRKQISAWLYESLLANKPFDQMTRELIAPSTAASRGFIDGIKWRGEVSAGQTLPIQFSQSVSQSFLGINMKCASCHDSFIDRWTLEDAYGLAAVYADQSLEIHRCDKPVGKTATASWIFPELGSLSADAPRDERLKQLASLMTSPENGRFARTIVNRLWYRLMGRGIVHPVDAMQTEPWCEPLIDYLACELIDSGYDLKHVLKVIATSQAYQSKCATADTINETEFNGPLPRRMTAEQFLDAVWSLADAAPDDYEAPVFRAFTTDSDEADNVEVTAKWIWGTDREAINPAPAGEKILLRRMIDLTADVDRAAAVITCDNAFQLFVNGRLVADGNDWAKPAGVVLTDKLKKGSNRIEAIASNGGKTPNAAGFLFEARIKLTDGESLTIASDETWVWDPNPPKTREGRMGFKKGEMNPARVMPGATWGPRVESIVKQRVAWAETGVDLPVRASLLKNTALMRSLGRPTRDQIVSMRPDTLTTLEALDLANEPTLNDAFRRGGERWANRQFQSTSQLVDTLFIEALSRLPADDERDGLIQFLGDAPTPEALQDALWAVCMLPEFLLVR